MIKRITKAVADATLSNPNTKLQVMIIGGGRFYLRDNATDAEQALFAEEWQASKEGGTELPSFPMDKEVRIDG